MFCWGCTNGEEVAAPLQPKRLITLAPNLTEIIFAMECADRIVGADDNSTWPAAARRIPKVGQGLTPNIERIARLRPDLVVASASTDQGSLRARLSRLKIELHVERTDRLDDLPAAARRLGRAIGCSGAEQWGRAFAEQIRQQRRHRAHAPRILFLAWADPLYVAGSDTFANDLITTVGGTNAAAQVKGWPQYSLEAVAANPPEVMVFPTSAVSAEQFLATMRAHRVWRKTAAVERGHVLVVDEDTFTHAGPRTIEAATILNRELDRLGYK